MSKSGMLEILEKFGSSLLSIYLRFTTKQYRRFTSDDPGFENGSQNSGRE
jgi:hypothetical protein